MPGLGCSGTVLEGEGEDGSAFFDGVGTVGWRGRERGRDGVEGGGGGERVWNGVISDGKGWKDAIR